MESRVEDDLNEDKTKSRPETPQEESTATTSKNSSSSKKGNRRNIARSDDDVLPADEIQKKFQLTDERLQEIEQTHNLSAHNVKSILNRLVKDPEVISKFNLFAAGDGEFLETTERSTRSKTKQHADPKATEIQLRPLKTLPYYSLSHLSAEAFNYDESQDDDDIDYNPDNPDDTIMDEELNSEQSASESGSNSSDSSIYDLGEEEDRESELDDSLMFSGGVQLSDDEQDIAEACEPSTSYATRSRMPNTTMCGEDDDLTDFFDGFHFTTSENSNEKGNGRFSPLNIPFCRFENLDYDETHEDEDDDYNPQDDDDMAILEKGDELCTKKFEIPRKEVELLYHDILDVENIVKVIPEIRPLVKNGRNRLTKSRKRDTKRWPQDHIKPTALSTATSVSCSLLGKKPNEIVFLPSEYDQLCIQLEQHVQLMVQMVVCTHHTPELKEYRNEYQTKINLMEEYYRKFGDHSFFNVSNLADAIATCHEINNTKPILSKHIIWAKRCDLNDHFIRPEACYILSRSKAILYPDLVPEQRPNAANLGTTEFTVVDNVLLALGLLQFGHVPNAIGSELHEFCRYGLISSNLLRGKLPVKIKDHLSKIRYMKHHLLYRLISQCESENPEITFRLHYDRIEGSMEEWSKEHLPMWYKEFFERFKAKEKNGKIELHWIPPPDDHIENKSEKRRRKSKSFFIARRDRTFDKDGIRRSKREKPGEKDTHKQEAEDSSFNGQSNETGPPSLSSLADQVNCGMNRLDGNSAIVDDGNATPSSPVPTISSEMSTSFSTPRDVPSTSYAATPCVPIAPVTAAMATPIPAGTRFMVRNANGEISFLSFGTDEVFMIADDQPPGNDELLPCNAANPTISELTPTHSMEEFVILSEEKMEVEETIEYPPFDDYSANDVTLHSDAVSTCVAPEMAVGPSETPAPVIWDSPGADDALNETIGAGIVEPKTPEKSVIRGKARRQILISPSIPEKTRSPKITVLKEVAASNIAEPSRDPRICRRKRKLSTQAEHTKPTTSKRIPMLEPVLDHQKLPQEVSVAEDTKTKESSSSAEIETTEDLGNAVDTHIVFPSTSSCSFDVRSVGSHSNAASCVPLTPMPRTPSDTSQISPRTISHSPIDEDTNMMIPRTPRNFCSQSPTLTPLPLHHRFRRRIVPEENIDSGQLSHPFVSLYEELDRRCLSPEASSSTLEKDNSIMGGGCTLETDESILSKMTRVQKMRAGEEGMLNSEYRDKQKALLSRKIWSDVRQRLSMHAETWNHVQNIVKEHESDAEMQIAELYDLLFEQHIDSLVLLTIFAPPDCIPWELLHHPLRKSYSDAFEMLMLIDAYAEHRKKRSARTWLRTLKTGMNCSPTDVCHHVRNLCGNDKPLWNKLKEFLPLPFDKEVLPENFEHLDLTDPTTDDLICEHIILEPQSDGNDDQTSNKSMQLVGGNIFVQKGGNTVEVDVHVLKPFEQHRLPAIHTAVNTKAAPSPVEEAPSLYEKDSKLVAEENGQRVNFDTPTKSDKVVYLGDIPSSNTPLIDYTTSPVKERDVLDNCNLSETAIDGNRPCSSSLEVTGEPPFQTSPVADSNNENTSQLVDNADVVQWTKEQDLLLVELYNNSENDDENLIASEASELLPHTIENIVTRLNFLLSMFG